MFFSLMKMDKITSSTEKGLQRGLYWSLQWFRMCLHAKTELVQYLAAQGWYQRTVLIKDWFQTFWIFGTYTGCSDFRQCLKSEHSNMYHWLLNGLQHDFLVLFCPKSELSGNGTKLNCLKSKLVWISDIHCTCLSSQWLVFKFFGSFWKYNL